MVLEREVLKQILAERALKSKEDLQTLLRDMTRDVLEAFYDGEITEHLGYGKYEPRPDKNNARNGFSGKKVKSHLGEIELKVPRDRQGTFEPQIIQKRTTDITGIELKVISMYAKGMSTRDIGQQIEEIYGYKVSPETVSNITDQVLPLAQEWQNRPLQSTYAIVFMDAMFIKIRVDGVVQNRTVYVVLGIDMEGEKKCLGIYYFKNESASGWLNVLNELKNRGVESILIFSVDNLTGISDAIKAAFPKAEIQKCIVHQVRSSLKFVPWKERKAVASGLKAVYGAATLQEAEKALNAFSEKWDLSYPNISKSWRTNWAELSVFFKYPELIRRLIYTTNPVESFHRRIRKVTKTKSIYPNEDALTKQLYLVIMETSKRWTKQIPGWGLIYPQLFIYFEEQLEKKS